MSIAQSFLAEFEQEAKTTRKFLERLPEDKLTGKPHERSMSAGQLALHIAASPGRVVQMASATAAEAPNFDGAHPQPASRAEILQTLDPSLAAVREVLPTLDDNRMQATWSAQKDGRVVLSMPRTAFLRSILLNHGYHHRGQFGVYLRLLGAKVPAAYGPSADEMPDFMVRAAS